VKTFLTIVLLISTSPLIAGGTATAGQKYDLRSQKNIPGVLRDRLNRTGRVPTGYSESDRELSREIGARGRSSLSSERRSDRSIFRNPSEGKMIEEYCQSWNGSAWVDEIRWLYTYDSSGNLLEDVRQSRSGSAWVNAWRWTMEYDSNGNDTTEVRQYWSGGVWVNDFKWTYSYDSIGQWIGEFIETWTAGAWENYVRWTYMYNGNGDLYEELQETYSGSAFTNYRRYTGTYSGLNLMTYARESWIGSVWAPDFHINYTHDGNGNFLTETRQDWSGSIWENSWRYTNTYDLNDNDISWLFEVWLTGSWMLSDLDSLSYDGSENIVGRLHKYYDAGWIDDWRGIFTYYGNGDWMEDVYQVWNTATWVNDERYYPVWKSPGSAQMYPVQDKWNMVSVPLTLDDYTTKTVFPNAVSAAFEFTTMYTAATVLENGPGYWVKFKGAQNVSMTGILRSADTFAVASGWNMIGSIGGSVDVSSITSGPPGLVTSSFFGFTNMYSPSTTIDPGKAYWVKMTGPGSLMLSTTAAPPSANRIRIVPTDEMPPPPPGDLANIVRPSGYDLAQNYPNPFNPVTEIHYTIPLAGHVRVSVFNMLGQEVVRLVDGVHEAGVGEVSFDAGSLPSGVYAYKITAGSFSATRRMLLLR